MLTPHVLKQFTYPRAHGEMRLSRLMELFALIGETARQKSGMHGGPCIFRECPCSDVRDPKQRRLGTLGGDGPRPRGFVVVELRRLSFGALEHAPFPDVCLRHDKERRERVLKINERETLPLADRVGVLPSDL